MHLPKSLQACWLFVQRKWTEESAHCNKIMQNFTCTLSLFLIQNPLRNFICVNWCSEITSIAQKQRKAKGSLFPRCLFFFLIKFFLNKKLTAVLVFSLSENILIIFLNHPVSLIWHRHQDIYFSVFLERQMPDIGAWPWAILKQHSAVLIWHLWSATDRFSLWFLIADMLTGASQQV